MPAIFDTLYRYKYLARPYELTPGLAADFPIVSEDGLTYEIRIRPDARFSDSPVFEDGRGRLVTASDVAWSIALHFDPSQSIRCPAGASATTPLLKEKTGTSMPPEDFDVPGLEVVDAITLRIHLREPFPMLLHTLATAQSGIVPHEAVLGLGPAFGVQPVGSGPFRLIAFDETQVVLVKNESFDRGPVDLEMEGYDPALHAGFGLEAIDGQPYPLIDRLEVQFISEASARWNSFRSKGGADIVMLPPELASTVLDDDRPPSFRQETLDQYHALATPEAGFAYYGINLGNPEIGNHPDPQRKARNRELRCALGQSLNWGARNEQFYHGLGEYFPGVIPPMLPSWDESITRVEFDPQGAQARWQAAGWSADSLPRLIYGQQSGVQQGQHFEMFRANLIAAGYPAERIGQRIYPTFAELLRAINAGEADVFLMGWTMAYPDAQYNLQLFYGPNSAPGVNSSRYRNPAFDQSFERALSLPDQASRVALYRDLNQSIIDDCVIMGSMVRTRIHLWKRHVRMLPDREIVGGFFLPFVDIDLFRPTVSLPSQLGRLLLRRAIGAIPLILGVTLISFLLTSHFGPDPVWELAGRNPTASELAELQAQLDQGRSWTLRYVDFLKGLVTFDLGHSLISGESVSGMLARSVPVTLALMLPGLIIGILLALGLAYLAARFEGRALDRWIGGFSALGMSISLVIFVMLCQLVFSVWLGWFPARGWSTRSIGDWLMHVSLPTLIVVLVNLGYNVRFFRSMWLEALAQPAVKSARAYGLSEWQIFFRRLLPWACGPILTRLTFSVPMLLLAGSLVIESHFGIPGVGRVFYNAILAGDQPVILGIVVLASLLVVAALVLVESLVQWSDPRLRAA